MNHMTIRSTAGDGVWLDGVGGLAHGVAMASNSGTHVEPLMRDTVFLDVPAKLQPGSDGAWLAWGFICPQAGKSLMPADWRKARGVSARCGVPGHFNCRCRLELRDEGEEGQL